MTPYRGPRRLTLRWTWAVIIVGGVAAVLGRVLS